MNSPPLQGPFSGVQVLITALQSFQNPTFHAGTKSLCCQQGTTILNRCSLTSNTQASKARQAHHVPISVQVLSLLGGRPQGEGGGGRGGIRPRGCHRQISLPWSLPGCTTCPPPPAPESAPNWPMAPAKRDSRQLIRSSAPASSASRSRTACCCAGTDAP